MGWAWMGPAHACRSLALSHPGRLLQWPVNSRHLCVRGFICMWAHRWPRRTSCYMATAAARPAAKFWQIRSGQAPQCSAVPRRVQKGLGEVPLLGAASGCNLGPSSSSGRVAGQSYYCLLHLQVGVPAREVGSQLPQRHHRMLSRSSAPSCQALLEHRHLHRPGLPSLGDRAAAFD